MSVVLDFLRRSNNTPSPDQDVYSIDKSAAIASDSVFRDIYLDLETTSYFTTNRLDVKESAKDVRTLVDEDAVIQSIRNILTTSPGQKLLNPRFGVNIGDLLFEGVTFEHNIIHGNHSSSDRTVASGLHMKNPDASNNILYNKETTSHKFHYFYSYKI